MRNNTNSTPSEAFSRKRAGLTAISSSLIFGVMSFTGISAASAAEAPVGLGTADSFSVLGGQAVTNTGSSVLGQDLGVSPGTAITGFPPGLVLGSTHAADAVALQAQSDLVVAYDDAAGRAPTQSVAGDLVGQTLPGGVYNSSGPLAVSGTLTLDGQGDPSSVFVFQVASTLTTATASSVSLINGAQACNVYWQIGSSATLGTASVFKGTIMALTSISVTTDTTVEGRALARNGAVTLDNNVFTAPGCLTSIPAPTPSETVTPVPSESPSATPAPTATVPPLATPAPIASGAPVVSVPATPAVIPSTVPGAGIGMASGAGAAPDASGEDAGTDASAGQAGNNASGMELAKTGVETKHWVIGGAGLVFLILGLLMIMPKTFFSRKH